MKERVKKGLWHGGPTPFGYSYGKESERIEVIPKQAETVQAIYSTYLETGCLHETKEQINAQGLWYRRGEKWTVPRLRVVLKRKRYTGLMWCGDVEKMDYSVKIIEQEDFDKVQQLLEIERDLKLPEPVGEEIDKVKHLHLNKQDRPPCPQCGLQHAVEINRKRHLANGTVKTVYICRICHRYFDDETGYIKIPPCPQCQEKDEVQYFNTWGNNGSTFRVYRCRRRAKPFRILVHMK